MTQTLVNIRMEKELKKDMEETCKTLGMNMTTAFTIFAKKMSREQRIPFEVSVDPFYGTSNTAAVLDSISQVQNGRTVEKNIEQLEALNRITDDGIEVIQCKGHYSDQK